MAAAAHMKNEHSQRRQSEQVQRSLPAAHAGQNYFDEFAFTVACLSWNILANSNEIRYSGKAGAGSL